MQSKHVGCIPKKNKVLLEIGQIPFSKKTNASKQRYQSNRPFYLTMSPQHRQPVEMPLLWSVLTTLFLGRGAPSSSSSAPLLPPEFLRHVFVGVRLPHTAGRSLGTVGPSGEYCALVSVWWEWRHSIFAYPGPFGKTLFSLQTVLCCIC